MQAAYDLTIRIPDVESRMAVLEHITFSWAARFKKGIERKSFDEFFASYHAEVERRADPKALWADATKEYNRVWQEHAAALLVVGVPAYTA
jgi:hypothetical protein